MLNVTSMCFVGIGQINKNRIYRIEYFSSAKFGCVLATVHIVSLTHYSVVIH